MALLPGSKGRADNIMLKCLNRDKALCDRNLFSAVSCEEFIMIKSLSVKYSLISAGMYCLIIPAVKESVRGLMSVKLGTFIPQP